MDTKELKRLEVFAAQIRCNVLEMLEHTGYGHLGGALSIVEVLSVLYGKQMHIDPSQPHMEDRDMFVLSKGHAGPALYSTLAQRGYFEKDILMTLNEGGTCLPSHPDRLKTVGIDMTTGSLGQGTSAAAGIATAQRIKQNNRYTYLVVGDGELNEGQCWEAFQYIAHYKLNNCIVFIDDNKRQLDGYTKDVMNPFSIEDKMKAFGFHVQVVKGDDVAVIDQAIEQAKCINDQAVCIILDTIKGQGVPYFENMFSNHSVKFNNDEVKNANHEAIKGLKAFIAKEGTSCFD